MCFYQEIKKWAHNNCNICGLEELTKTTNYLNKEFEMKDLGEKNSVLAYKSSIVQVAY